MAKNVALAPESMRVGGPEVGGRTNGCRLLVVLLSRGSPRPYSSGGGLVEKPV